jgi:hypothetical protein
MRAIPDARISRARLVNQTAGARAFEPLPHFKDGLRRAGIPD